MTSRWNYRLKVDLSRYHRDARRSSWIYVDCTNVWFISHLKQHIADIFGTQEPFDLLLNGNEYLPPREDVRILKEDELIAVVPGTDASKLPISSPGMCHAINNQSVEFADARSADCQKTTMCTDVEESNSKALNNTVADVTAFDSTMYHSMREEPEMEDSPDAKATDDTITDNCSMTDPYGAPVHKRKRIRRKRSKPLADTSLTDKTDNKSPSVYHKAKVLQLAVLPTGKHIHFDNADDKISVVAENGGGNPAIENKRMMPTAREPHTIHKSKVPNLSTLLALRQCSTPLTFVNKKPKNEFEVTTKNNVNMDLHNTPKVEQTIQEGQSNGKIDAAKTIEEESDYSNIDPEKYPSLGSETVLDDVIAFKILRIGKEYTPEVSDYIVARTISWCPKKSLFTFQILKGQMQIQTPLGKFSLQDDESENQTYDTASFNFSQLIEPRLIYRK